MHASGSVPPPDSSFSNLLGWSTANDLHSPKRLSRYRQTPRWFSSNHERLCSSAEMIDLQSGSTSATDSSTDSASRKSLARLPLSVQMTASAAATNVATTTNVTRRRFSCSHA
ncbi:uncharacterized protein IUM83_08297 [Phytophthora cinnamomi]|uniref:uncharacterized protein n=1 Tax=Phytophthora cinnamomi TaxID=4785 RepID=UPI00355A1A4F|nr:hypothetical protein IUM83_08297 [Phytophthora cinnamomi]